MTQDSLFHSGRQRGDGRAYSASEFHEVMTFAHLGQGGFVISSGTLDVLNVAFSAGQVVTVAAGSAFVAGVYYNNSASLNITLENNDTIYTRIDRIVIQVSWENQTARAVAKRGAASSAPEPPSLQQDIGTIYEIPLALIFVPASFAGFGDEYILDQRVFTGLVGAGEELETRNLMYNSEFLMPEENTSYTTGWETGSGVRSYLTPPDADKFDLQARGRSPIYRVTSNFPLTTSIYLNNSTTTRVVFAFIVQVTRRELYFSLDGGATLLYKIPPTNEPIIVIARTTVGSAGANQTIAPYLYGASASLPVEFKLGQLTLSFGNVVAPFMPQHETILGTIAYYSNVSGGAVGGGDTLEKVDYVFNEVWPGIRHMYVKFYAQDSNCANDAIYAGLYQSGSVAGGTNIPLNIELGRHTNSRPRYLHGTIAPELEYSNYSISNYLNEIFWKQRTYYNANGTLSYQLYVAGIET